MKPEEIAEVLEDAAQLLEHGWTRGVQYRPVFGKYASYCAVGAIRHVAWLHQYPNTVPECVANTRRAQIVVEVLARHLLGEQGKLNDSWPMDHVVFSWNDSDARTKQEVLDTFHLVAKKVQGVEP